MKKILFASLLFLPAACKPQGHADNSATRYAESLKQDTVKARENAAKANEAVAQENARMDEAQKADQ